MEEGNEGELNSISEEIGEAQYKPKPPIDIVKIEIGEKKKKEYWLAQRKKHRDAVVFNYLITNI